jgi:PAS domain S-box-containing protein
MTDRRWEQLAAELDKSFGDHESALAALSEFAEGMFPDGLPDLRRATWHERAERSGAATGDPRADAEARLRAAEQRFRTLVEQIPAVTFMAVLGEGRNEIYVSPHIEALLGYTQEEWLSDPFLWYWRLHPEDRGLWNDEFARGCRTGGPFRADCRFIARDGTVVWVHGEARLIRDDLGRPSLLQGIAFDISDIKRAQEVLVTEAVGRAKLQEELAIARRVQTSILPRSLAVPGLEIAAAMEPAEDVGGDYYDVLPATDGCWVAIGDVAGHGLDAGLIMLMVQAATATLARTRPNATPRELLCLLNEVLYSNIRERLAGDAHVTFTLGRFKSDGTFLFTGGHEDIIVIRNDATFELMRPPGTWLGARPDIRRVTVDATLKVEPGELIILYTDGLTEARNDRRQQYDISRLCDAAVRLRGEPVEAIRDAIFKEVDAWSPLPDDDRTLLVMRYRPVDEEADPQIA